MKSFRIISLCIIVALSHGCAIFGDPDEVAVLDMGTDVRGGSDDAETPGDVADTDDLGTENDTSTPDSGSPDDAALADASNCPGVDLQTDPSNCGGCGETCLGDCEAGRCDAYVVAEGQSLPYGIEVDATHVYWSNQDPGSIWRAPIDGGPPEELAGQDASGVQMNPRYLHLTATDVIVSVRNSGTLNHIFPLFRVPKNGGIATGFGAPVADGTQNFVIWNGTAYAAFPRQDQIHAARLGQDTTILAAGMVPEPYTVLVFQEKLYFVGPRGIGTVDVDTEEVQIVPGTETAEAFRAVADDETMFVAANTDILAMTADETLITLQSELFEAESIALAGDFVVVATGVDQASGSIYRMAKDGTGLVELAGRISHIENIDADAENVWVVSRGEDEDGGPAPDTGRILRVPVQPED